MKTLVLYATKYGSTKEAAEKIAEKMPGEALSMDVSAQTADPSSYDAVILGTPIYVGKPRKEMKQFVQTNMPKLLEKKVGLFICCLQDENDSVSRQFQIAFPKELRDHASALAALGGVMDKGRLNRLDGFIMRLVSTNLPPHDGVLSTMSQERMDQLVELMTAETVCED